jgi:hypothetical protein
MKPNFKYDVAFSFLSQDEKLAQDLFDLLKDTLNCFIHSEEQKKLAGTEGEVTFNKVFTEEARVVVILYRKGWGETNWTRIEETAIRNRGHDEGYDFALLIPLDEIPKPPKWFPKNRLWIGINRFGIENAATVIDARVQQQDGKPKILSLADKIVIKEKQKEKRREIELFLISYEGICAEKEELLKLKLQIEQSVLEIKQKAPKWHLHLRENNHNGIDLLSNGYQLSLHYYVNSHPPYLFLSIFKGYLDEREFTLPFNPVASILTERFKLDINLFNQTGWSIKDNRSEFKTTRQFVDYYLIELTSYAMENNNKQNN